MKREEFEQARDKIVGAARIRQGIGTLSEKTVHAVLKNAYAPDETMHEIPIENYVADIYTGEEIIEIQTRNLNKMRPKLDLFLPMYPVTVVYPIPHKKWLIWIDEETGEYSPRRKSPVTGNAYMAFPELYKIKQYLTDENIRLRFVLFDVEELRLLNGWSKDKKKGSSRFDRIPLDFYDEICIDRKEDYMQFVPCQLEDGFTVKDFAAAARIPRGLAQITVHILHYVGILDRTGKKGRQYEYHIHEIYCA